MSLDNRTRVWDVATETLVGRPMEGVTLWSSGGAFSPDGKYVVVGGAGVTGPIITDNGEIRVRNLATGVEKVLIQRKGAWRCVEYSPDGRYLAATLENEVWVWTDGLATGPKTFKGHVGRVDRLAFSPQGDRIATEATDGTVRVWNLDGVRPDKPECVMEHQHGGVLYVAFDPAGQRVVIVGEDGTARIWELECGRPEKPPDWELIGHHGEVWHAAFDPTGRRVVIAGEDGTPQVWDLGDKRFPEPTLCWRASTAWCITPPLTRPASELSPLTRRAQCGPGILVVGETPNRSWCWWATSARCVTLLSTEPPSVSLPPVRMARRGSGISTGCGRPSGACGATSARWVTSLSTRPASAS